MVFAPLSSLQGNEVRKYLIIYKYTRKFFKIQEQRCLSPPVDTVHVGWTVILWIGTLFYFFNEDYFEVVRFWVMFIGSEVVR
jgi:hypothetical protein